MLKVERGRLNWVYSNQKTIKVEKYKGLIDAQNNGDINDSGKQLFCHLQLLDLPVGMLSDIKMLWQLLEMLESLTSSLQ